MLQVNQSSGDTAQFNLDIVADMERWRHLAGDPAFQGTITGASILWGGRIYAAPRPAKFKAIVYEVSLIRSRDGEHVTGEQIIVQADATRYVLTVWRGQNGSCKVEVERAGRRVHAPPADVRSVLSDDSTLDRAPHECPCAAEDATLVAVDRMVS